MFLILWFLHTHDRWRVDILEQSVLAMLQNDDRDTDPAQYEDKGFSVSCRNAARINVHYTFHPRGKAEWITFHSTPGRFHTLVTGMSMLRGKI